MEETDAQLHLKKRARRRLVGAVAFVVLVAIVLPMIMDHEPKQIVQDVEIRIPGQDEKPFAPKFATAPVDKPVVKPAEPHTSEHVAEKPPEPAPVRPPTARMLDKPVEQTVDRPAERAPEKIPAKPEIPPVKPEKTPAKPEKPVEKPLEKPVDKPVAREVSGDEARRAAAILAGKPAEPAAGGGEHIILIGAFANEGNVKLIRNKLGELGIKAYTEPLDSPQGPKTRVRAGPFPSREAAEKALEKMKRIGVSGVVAAKP